MVCTPLFNVFICLVLVKFFTVLLFYILSVELSSPRVYCMPHAPLHSRTQITFPPSLTCLLLWTTMASSWASRTTASPSHLLRVSGRGTHDHFSILPDCSLTLARTCSHANTQRCSSAWRIRWRLRKLNSRPPNGAPPWTSQHWACVFPLVFARLPRLLLLSHPFPSPLVFIPSPHLLPFGLRSVRMAPVCFFNTCHQNVLALLRLPFSVCQSVFVCVRAFLSFAARGKRR